MRSLDNDVTVDIVTVWRAASGTPRKQIKAHVTRSNGTPLQYSCLEKSHGRRSLVGRSPWGHEESDTTERLHFHFSLSHIGEGNGNPPQCSCLENPRDGGAWWAAVYGVTQSQTRLKRLSSSSTAFLSFFFPDNTIAGQ